MKRSRELYEGEYLDDNDHIDSYGRTKFGFFEKLNIDLPKEDNQKNKNNHQSDKFSSKIQSIDVDFQIEPQSESMPQQIPFEKIQKEEIFTFTLHNTNQMLSSPPQN